MVSKTDNITNIPDYNPKGMTENEVNRAIDFYLKSLVNSGQMPQEGGSILKYLELVQNAVKSRQNTENIPENRRLLVLYDDPPDEKEVDTEAITFYLEERGPGQWGQGSFDVNTKKELKHHVRSIQQHPEHPSEKLVTMGRGFENNIVFNIYARTDKQALKRVLWFENVMDSFAWYYRVNRIRSIQKKVIRTGPVTIGELSLAKYSMLFHVRTEDSYQFGSQELKKITLDMNI